MEFVEFLGLVAVLLDEVFDVGCELLDPFLELPDFLSFLFE